MAADEILRLGQRDHRPSPSPFMTFSCAIVAAPCRGTRAAPLPRSGEFVSSGRSGVGDHRRVGVDDRRQRAGLAHGRIGRARRPAPAVRARSACWPAIRTDDAVDVERILFRVVAEILERPRGVDQDENPPLFRLRVILLFARIGHHRGRWPACPGRSITHCSHSSMRRAPFHGSGSTDL